MKDSVHFMNNRDKFETAFGRTIIAIYAYGYYNAFVPEELKVCEEDEYNMRTYC